MEKEKFFCDSHAVAVDMVIFTVIDGELKILLIKRGLEPKGTWALPGGFIKAKESLEAAAKRELFEETGVKLDKVYLEQLYTFGEPERDPRFRVISVTYFALVNHEGIAIKSGSDAADAAWYPARKIPKLAFDHQKIVSYAVKRLVWKIEYTNVVFGLLPTRFTLTQLQKSYEAIAGHELDKRNFRRKFLATGLIKPTKSVESGAHRPAVLYEFSTHAPEFIKNPFGNFLNK